MASIHGIIHFHSCEIQANLIRDVWVRNIELRGSLSSRMCLQKLGCVLNSVPRTFRRLGLPPMNLGDRLVLSILLTGASVLTVTSLHAQPGFIDARLAPGIDAVNQIFAVSPTPDGKILIGGFFVGIRGLPLNHIARLNADGQVDSSFRVGTAASGAS